MVDTITTDMIQAGLQSGEFFLQYQPILSLSDERCIGAEALIRWWHNDGLISPAHFILIAENTPTSGMLTYWVMKEAA